MLNQYAFGVCLSQVWSKEARVFEAVSGIISTIQMLSVSDVLSDDPKSHRVMAHVLETKVTSGGSRGGRRGHTPPPKIALK